MTDRPASSPVVRQVDALLRKFGWSFNQAARAAFPLLGGERRVEHPSDLLHCAFFDVGRFMPDRSMRARRCVKAQDIAPGACGMSGLFVVEAGHVHCSIVPPRVYCSRLSWQAI